MTNNVVDVVILFLLRNLCKIQTNVTWHYNFI